MFRDCCISTNRKAEVISFTSLGSLLKLLSLVSALSRRKVRKFFSRIITKTSRSGNRVELIVTESKDFGLMYRLNCSRLHIQFHYGEWNAEGFPRHNCEIAELSPWYGLLMECCGCSFKSSEGICGIWYPDGILFSATKSIQMQLIVLNFTLHGYQLIHHWHYSSTCLSNILINKIISLKGTFISIHLDHKLALLLPTHQEIQLAPLCGWNPAHFWRLCW